MIRVAFGSSDGKVIDQHFGTAERFTVWEVGPERAEPQEKIVTVPTGEGVVDKVVARAETLRGCTLVYITDIGGPAAARLVQQRMVALKAPSGASIRETVARLQELLMHRPPPWLRKALANDESTAGPEAPLES